MKVEKRSDATDVSCAKSDRASIRLVTALADWPYLSAILFLTSLLIHPSKSASYRSTAHCNIRLFLIHAHSLSFFSFFYFHFAPLNHFILASIKLLIHSLFFLFSLLFFIFVYFLFIKCFDWIWKQKMRSIASIVDNKLKSLF